SGFRPRARASISMIVRASLTSSVCQDILDNLVEAAMVAKTKKPAKQDKAGLACSFCGKTNKEAPSLLAAGARPGVYICGLCVGACNQVLAGVPTEGPADWTKRSDEEL